MSAEALLARQGLRARPVAMARMSVEDASDGQFAAAIDAFAKPTFESGSAVRVIPREYLDPTAAPITRPDAEWAIEEGESWPGANCSPRRRRAVQPNQCRAPA